MKKNLAIVGFILTIISLVGFIWMFDSDYRLPAFITSRHIFIYFFLVVPVMGALSMSYLDQSSEGSRQ